MGHRDEHGTSLTYTLAITRNECSHSLELPDTQSLMKPKGSTDFFSLDSVGRAESQRKTLLIIQPFTSHILNLQECFACIIFYQSNLAQWL